MKVCIGRLTKPHGVRGEMVLQVRTDEPERRFRVGSELQTDPPDRGPLTLTAVRRHHGRYLVRLREVPDRAAAERLGGTVLVAEGDTSPRLTDPDEYWDHHLVGLRVETPDGRGSGVVADVLHPSAGEGADLLVVRADEDGREVLVPFVARFVPRVDVEAGVVVIDPPEGLWET